MRIVANGSSRPREPDRNPGWPERGANGEISAGKRAPGHRGTHTALTWRSDTKMTTRNLSRRLERLEASTLPTSEAKDIMIRFLSSEGGRVVSTMRLEVAAVPQPRGR